MSRDKPVADSKAMARDRAAKATSAKGRVDQAAREATDTARRQLDADARAARNLVAREDRAREERLRREGLI